MKQHDWIIEVCEDLKSYAKEHNLAHLEAQLNTALTAARHDVLLARVDAVHHETSNCAVLGAHIGVCNHQGTGTRDIEDHAVARRQ